MPASLLRERVFKPSWHEFSRAGDRQLRWYEVSTIKNKLTSSMKSVELSSQQPYTFSLHGNIHARGGGIDGLPAALFCGSLAAQHFPTCLNPTLALSSQYIILLVANLMTFSNVITQELSPVSHGR